MEKNMPYLVCVIIGVISLLPTAYAFEQPTGNQCLDISGTYHFESLQANCGGASGNDTIDPPLGMLLSKSPRLTPGHDFTVKHIPKVRITFQTWTSEPSRSSPYNPCIVDFNWGDKRGSYSCNEQEFSYAGKYRSIRYNWWVSNRVNSPAERYGSDDSWTYHLDGNQNLVMDVTSVEYTQALRRFHRSPPEHVTKTYKVHCIFERVP